jgi:hypothetical protein
MKKKVENSTVEERVVDKDDEIQFDLYLSADLDLNAYEQLAKNKKGKNVVILSNDNRAFFIIDGQLATKSNKKIQFAQVNRHSVDFTQERLEPSQHLMKDKIIAEALAAGGYLPRLTGSLPQSQTWIKTSEYHGITFRYIDVSVDDLKLGLRRGLFFKDSMYRTRLKSLRESFSLYSIFIKIPPRLTTTATERVLNKPSFITGGSPDLKSCYDYLKNSKEKENKEVSGFVLVIGHVPADDKAGRIKTFANLEFLLENGIPNPYAYEREILHRSKQPGKSVDFTDLVLGVISAKEIRENLSKTVTEQTDTYTNVFNGHTINLSTVFAETEKELAEKGYQSEILQELRKETLQFHTPAPAVKPSEFELAEIVHAVKPS